jgi:hypothetical protein
VAATPTVVGVDRVLVWRAIASLAVVLLAVPSAALRVGANQKVVGRAVEHRAVRVVLSTLAVPPAALRVGANQKLVRRAVELRAVRVALLAVSSAAGGVGANQKVVRRTNDHRAARALVKVAFHVRVPRHPRAIWAVFGI